MAGEHPAMRRIAAYDMPRRKAALLALMVGLALGLLNTALDVRFIPETHRPAGASEEAGTWGHIRPFLILAVKLTVAVAAVIALHEGVHGAAALLLGYRPRFGMKPPLVYVTFDVKLPRGSFMIVALAPLLVLDALFAAMLLGGVLPVFSHLCLMVNSIGSVGDVWIVTKLVRHARGSLVQDTMTGIEVWAKDGSSGAGRRE